jgi:hypothetical protein
MGKRIIVAAIAFFSSAVIFAQSDVQAINQLIDKMTKAWLKPVEESLSVWREVASDETFVMVLHNPEDESRTVALTKQDFLGLMRMIMSNGALSRNVHTILKLQVYGNIAYEMGEGRSVDASGKESRVKIFNMFRKEAGGWKLIESSGLEEIQAFFAQE